jgi:hypothetical protein
MIVEQLEGIVGSTWVVVVTSAKLDGVEISEETLALCTVAGRVGGIASTGAEIDPETGVRARVRVSAAASSAAVAQSAPYVSQIDVTFPNGDKLSHQFRFKVLPAAD